MSRSPPTSFTNQVTWRTWQCSVGFYLTQGIKVTHGDTPSASKMQHFHLSLVVHLGHIQIKYIISNWTILVLSVIDGRDY